MPGDNGSTHYCVVVVDDGWILLVGTDFRSFGRPVARALAGSTGTLKSLAKLIYADWMLTVGDAGGGNRSAFRGGKK